MARAEVDRAEAALGVDDWCQFCSVMLSVPAAIACARSGDVDHARHHLDIAERSAKLWEAPAWKGWYAEAAGHIALAEGDDATARRQFVEAVVVVRARRSAPRHRPVPAPRRCRAAS